MSGLYLYMGPAGPSLEFFAAIALATYPAYLSVVQNRQNHAYTSKDFLFLRENQEIMFALRTPWRDSNPYDALITMHFHVACLICDAAIWFPILWRGHHHYQLLRR